MLNTTIDVFKAGLRADPTVTPAERSRLLSLLRNDPQPATPAAPEPPRLLRREQVAQRLACSVRMIDLLARQGVLVRVTLPGRVRSAGFRESDIVALIARKAG